MKDINWLAGYLDGEGSFQQRKGVAIISAPSVDKDLVEHCRQLLGGTVSGPHVYQVDRQPQWRWQCSGARAAGAMMALYPLLCERRKWQIAIVLKEWKSRPPAERFKTHCPYGHEYTEENTIKRIKRIPGRNPSVGRVCRTCYGTKADCQKAA